MTPVSPLFDSPAFLRRPLWNAVLAFILFVGAPFSAHGALEIELLGSGDLITDQDVGMNGVYLGFRVTNSDQVVHTDLWVEANSGIWFVPAPREDGVHPIGDLAPGGFSVMLA